MTTKFITQTETICKVIFGDNIEYEVCFGTCGCSDLFVARKKDQSEYAFVYSTVGNKLWPQAREKKFQSERFGHDEIQFDVCDDEECACNTWWRGQLEDTCLRLEPYNQLIDSGDFEKIDRLVQLGKKVGVYILDNGEGAEKRLVKIEVKPTSYFNDIEFFFYDDEGEYDDHTYYCLPTLTHSSGCEGMTAEVIHTFPTLYIPRLRDLSDCNCATYPFSKFRF